MVPRALVVIDDRQRRMHEVRKSVVRLARDVDDTIAHEPSRRVRVSSRVRCLNLEAALAATGATLGDLVKTTTFVTDIEEYFKQLDVRME
jgi:hypothetical protein